jgi:nitrite reductase/ring-hydroxylating ferredoxin subunit
MTAELGDIVGAPWSRAAYAQRVESVVHRYEGMLHLHDHPRDGALMVRLLLDHPGALRESSRLDKPEIETRLEDARTELENVRAAAPLPAPLDRVERTRVLALADFEHAVREIRAARRRGQATVAPSQTLRAVAAAVAVRHGVPDFYTHLFPEPRDRGRVHVAHQNDIREGTAVRVEAFGRTIAMFRDAGELIAIEDSCPHRGGPLGKGTVAGGAVTCPLHGWTFDLRSGAMRGNPSLCIRRYPLTVDAGEVYLIAPAGHHQ